MNRIAIVRLTSLGDVVHTLPVAAAIRDGSPGTEIAWIVEEHEQVLVRDNPVVDRVIAAPLRRWRRWLTSGRVRAVAREVAAFVEVVRGFGADATLDVQGWVHKTSPIVALTRAPLRVGFARPYARDRWSPLFTNRHIVPGPSAVHVVDQNLALLEPLGIDVSRPRFVLPEWRGSRDRVARWMEDARLPAKPIVLLPSTRGPRKMWPAASYAELAARLAAHGGGPVVLAGGPADQDVFDRVVSRHGPLPIFAPEAVGDLATFLAGAAAVVGNDTGPLHLAAAAGVLSTGLFGPTSGARNGPYGSRGRFIQSRSGRVADIPVDDVFDTVVAELDRMR